MCQVVQILEGVLDVALPPIPRALQVMIDNHEHAVFFTKSSSSQSFLNQRATIQLLHLKQRAPHHQEVLKSV
ncbi:hypothetical protein WN944_010745 [Citrus x changshan-huyou]|uniref:Uncharacterized protein n=1 Tax=Citrus x changshan-huyou TaxID=2935761 RepID=A0AAP0QT59_9ROSI